MLNSIDSHPYIPYMSPGSWPKATEIHAELN